MPAHNVLFVCEFGSKKSLVAAQYFNRAAAEAGLDAHAVSRGLRPDNEIPQRFRDLLEGEGIDVSGVVPEALSERDIDGADLIVSFATHEEGLPATTKPVLFWTDAPAFSDDFDAAHTHIFARVQALVRTMAAS